MLTYKPLHAVAAVRDIETRAITELGGDSQALMQRAGLAAWRHARIVFPSARRWVVCCGTGNNGGDGYLFALHAARAGHEVRVIRLGAPASEESQRALGACRSAGVRVDDFAASPLPDADVVIDAVLGIGLVHAPRFEAASLIDAINTSPAHVLSLDTPSGLDTDSGDAPGSCVRAARTVTFLARKPGLHTGEGIVHAGIVSLARLDAAPCDGAANGIELLCGRARDALALRPLDDHKGRRGRALLIGGDVGMGGAIALSGESCARSGAGVVSIATRNVHVAPLLARHPELMVRGLDPEHENSLELSTHASWLRADVLGIGPGLGLDAFGRSSMKQVLDAELPRVFDADALTLLAEWKTQLREEDVITPHPGEAARLLECSTQDIGRDRFAAARRLAQTTGAVVVLKGAGTLIANSSGRIAVSPHAVPALATAGSGDVLTGLIVALRAQGSSAWDAACAGVLAHAECGLRARARLGSRGVLASDLCAELPVVLDS